MPKPVQIAVTGDPGSVYGSQVVVLCDDGSIWAGRPSDHCDLLFWRRLDDIPFERFEDSSQLDELIQQE